MLVTKESEERFRKHVKESPRCDQHGRVIGQRRSMWFRPFAGGSGEVRVVGIVYCEVHDKLPEMPPPGHPIYEDDCIEIPGDWEPAPSPKTPEGDSA